MKRPNRKDYINKYTKIQLIADQELYIGFLETEIKQLRIGDVIQQREQLIAFLEINNWLSLEDEENAKGVVDCYLKAINCG